MNHNDDDQLDTLLNQWANQTASDERVDSLHARIVASLTESSDEQSDKPHRRAEDVSPRVLSEYRNPEAYASGSPRHRAPGCQSSEYRSAGQPGRANRQSSIIAVTAAVSALSCLLLMLISSRPDSGNSGTPDAPPQHAWLSESQVSNKAVLFAELQNMFDRKLTWMVETGDGIEFDVSGTPRKRPADATEKPLAVRIVVQRRNPDQIEWQLAWTADVISQYEKIVRISSASPEGHRLDIWAWQLPDGLIAVDSELNLKGQHSLRAQASSLQQERRPAEIIRQAHDGAEYRVFQTVAVLHEGVS